MRVHVLYRTYPGANTKARPPWYSRTTALLSLRDSLAALAAPHHFTFVADRGMPAELEPLVRPTDEVVRIDAGRVARSFRRALALARDRARDEPDTLFWIAEDDYLYRPEAMGQLVEAADAAPQGSRLTLYAPDDTEWHAAHPSQPLRAVPPLPEPLRCSQSTWRRIPSSTSTTGITSRDLLRDTRLLSFVSRTGAPFDGPCDLAQQGVAPYDLRHVLADIDAGPGARGVVKAVGKPVMRVVTNAVAARPRRSPRRLLAPSSDLATHMEVDKIADGFDWPSLAASVAERHQGVRTAQEDVRPTGA